LRDGHLIADVARGQFDHDDLVQLIAGAITSAHVEHGRRVDGDAVLRARGIQGRTIRSLDIDVHAGEVVGVSGVLGSGREELASILFGSTVGEIADLQVGGRKIATLGPREAIEAGVAYVPADRHRHGAVMTMSVRENMTLPRLRPLQQLLGRLNRRAERHEVGGWIERLDIRPSDPERPLRLLSGGNQQKVVLAKWLRNEPKVLLMDEPTQSVDVGAKVGIFELIAQAASAGAGVLISSSDEKELALICDRVVVLRNGRQAVELHKSDLSEARLVAAGLGEAGANGG
jgi:ABC-type sugar transport system ATPase subunit